MNANNSSTSTLYLAPGLKIYKLADNHWQFVTLSSAFTIKCPQVLLQTLLEADGRQSMQAWLDAHQEQFPRDALQEFAASLSGRGILFERDQPQASAADAYFYTISNTRQNPDAAPFDCSAHTLHLQGEGCLRDSLHKLAQESGFALSDDAAQASLLLICADSPRHDAFRRANRELCVGLKKPAIFAWLDGSAGRLLRVYPHATGCFECLHHRMRAGKNFFREFDAASSGNALWHQRPLPPARIQSQHLAASTLMHVTAMLANQVLDLHENHLLECNALSGTERSAQVLKLPRCSVCGNGNTSQPFSPVYDFKGM